MKRQLQLYDYVRVTAAEGPRRDLFMKILQISQQEFYVVGTALVEGMYDVVQNNFHNVPDPTVEGSLYPEPAAYALEQFYISP